MNHRGGRPETHLQRYIDTQHGVFTRRQAGAAGLTARMIDRRIADGRWVVVHRGLYRCSATPETWSQRLVAACLVGPAVASHRSAGLLWGFPGMPPDVLEVTGLRHRRRKPPDMTWHESFHLSERDVTEVDGIPVTRPVRTFLDLGAASTADELEQVLNDGLRRKLFSVPTIGRRLEELGSLRRGTAVVRAVLARQVLQQRAPESVLETRFLQLVRVAGLPEPVPQYEIELRDGTTARVDFAYPERRIAIELDGAAYHFGDVAERRDRRRDNQLGAVGWFVRHFDWDDVTQRADYVLGLLKASA